MHEQVKAMRVDIETCSSLSAGQTVCDVWGHSPLPKNANVALVRWSAVTACLKMCIFSSSLAPSN